MDIPTEENEQPIEKGLPERSARHADDAWTPVRDGGEHFHRFQPRRDQSERQLQWGPLLAAAAAGFLIAILFGPSRSTNPLREEEVANLQSELQSARDRVAQLESELSARESDGQADAPEPTAKADAPEGGASEQQTAPAPKREDGSETSGEFSRKEPIANPEAAKAEAAKAEAAKVEAAKEAEPPTPTTPTPISNPPPKPSRTEPDQVAAFAEPQGAASVYDVPDPAAPTVRSTSRSGTPGAAVLLVLAPERAGWTTEAQPTLYWHASEGMQFPGEFTLFREGQEEPVLRARLTAPDGAGIQRIELSQSDISLDEGASYRWTVSFVAPEHSGTNLATGGIRRVAPPAPLRATGASPVAERLDALERAGLWYDALDLVTRSIENDSGAKNLVARRNAMLARVGIHLPGP